MGLKCGIVGLPNVGKSTLFNALTQAGIEAENFPFCTIEPNSGIVAVPDTRQDTLASIVNPKKQISATMEFVDIAGLVSGASRGEGLGNQFLGNIRETDAIAHVVRCFDCDKVVHVSNKISPKEDAEIINIELALADLERCERQLEKVFRVAKSGDQEAKFLTQLLEEKLLPHLSEAKPIRSLACEEPEKKLVRGMQLLTDKPTMYIANIDEGNFENNPYLEELKEFASLEGALVVPICNKIESEIAELSKEERQDFLLDLGVNEPGLNRVIVAGYELLNLHTFFTAGPNELRAWTIKAGSTAPDAAATIHTDFKRGFICAEVISYTDFILHQGEKGAKEAGKLRLEGKDYIVSDGDIIHYRFNV